MSKPAAIALALLVLTVPAGAQLTANATPAQVNARLHADGARKVLLELWNNEPVFDALLSHVDRGETRWFAVWLELRQPADAGISESIDMAFARALPRAPQTVLRFAGHGLTIEHICTSPFIEPDPGVAEAYERKTLRALAQVRAPQLKALARECAARVRLPKERH